MDIFKPSEQISLFTACPMDEQTKTFRRIGKHKNKPSESIHLNNKQHHYCVNALKFFS